MKPFDVIAVGLHDVDILYVAPDKIVAGEKYILERVALQGGGPAHSGLAAATRLGFRGAFVGKIGTDALSELSLAEMRRNGIDTSLLVRDAAVSPGVAIGQIGRATSERTFFVGMNNYGYLKARDIPKDAIRRAKLLMVDSYDLKAAEVALKAARGSACRTLVDFEGGDPKRLRALLALATDIILPLATARRLSGKKDAESALKALANDTDGQLVTTDGKRGSWALTPEGVVHVGIVDTGKRLDSTGCGDAFHGGYGIGILEGWDLKTRMEMGAFLAGLVLTGLGGRTALPLRADLKPLLKRLGKKLSPELRSGLLNLSNKTL